MRVRVTTRVRVRVRLGLGVRVWGIIRKNKENITNRMAKFQLREVWVVGIAQYLKAGTFLHIDHFFFLTTYMDNWHLQLSSAENERKQMFDVNCEFFAVLPLLIAFLCPSWLNLTSNAIVFLQHILCLSTHGTILCKTRKLHENGDK